MISGPLNSEGTVLWLPLSILEANETHPAVVRCQATCLNQQRIYRLAMALIITSQDQFVPVYYRLYNIYSRDGLYSEIHIGMSVTVKHKTTTPWNLSTSSTLMLLILIVP